MSFRTGEIIGPYRILGVAGTGGMGRVFKVEHTITRRIEALKIVAPDWESGPDQFKRFLREIEVHARLSHPNIAAVYNAFRLEDRVALVMEYVEGRPLEALLEQRSVPLLSGLDYMCQALSALDYAHAQSVVHRDIAPANIIIALDGTVKLMDFGLAKAADDVRLTQRGTAVGSLGYMSPEQVRGLATVDARSDIYSIGAILYEIAVGRPPFEDDNAFSLMLAHVNRDPIPPEQLNPNLPPGLSEIILKALAKSPVHRYESAKEFLNALDPFVESAFRAADPGTPRKSSSKVRGVQVPTVHTAVRSSVGQRLVLATVGILFALLLMARLPHSPVEQGGPGKPAASDPAAPVNKEVQPTAVSSPLVETTAPTASPPGAGALPEPASERAQPAMLSREAPRESERPGSRKPSRRKPAPPAATQTVLEPTRPPPKVEPFAPEAAASQASPVPQVESSTAPELPVQPQPAKPVPAAIESAPASAKPVSTPAAAAADKDEKKNPILRVLSKIIPRRKRASEFAGTVDR
ncbi:MAG: protein kinase [Acidobacteria bacterium]|nr:protein kinase [Acidobacteriota bacterium]